MSRIERGDDFAHRSLQLVVLARTEPEPAPIDIRLVARRDFGVQHQNEVDGQGLHGQRARRAPVCVRDDRVVEVDDRLREELGDVRPAAGIAEGRRERDDLERPRVVGTHGASPKLRGIRCGRLPCTQ